jgi:hypothetical protein
LTGYDINASSDYPDSQKNKTKISYKGRVFLVTNKHVLNPNPKLRNEASEIIKHTDNSITSQEAEFPAVIGNNKSYREHASQDVDVLAFDITGLLVEYPMIESEALPIDNLATKAQIQEKDIKIGDEILVIGYPGGWRQKNTNFPLVRSGIISTRIGEELEDDYKQPDGSIRKRVLRGFLIDGAVIPGSSGSPAHCY